MIRAPSTRSQPYPAEASPAGGSLRSLTIDPLRDPRWLEVVERAPNATIFHHPAWLRVVHDHFRYPVAACCVANTEGSPLAGVPVAAIASRLTGRRLVAYPFSDLCPPLIAAGAPRGTHEALGRALAMLLLQRAEPLEIRGGTALPDSVPGPRFHHHVVRLEPDVDAVQARFRKPQVLRGVRRARREGLTVERATDTAALTAFYRLHVATRARLGVPTHPRRFVLRFAELFAGGRGFVLLVRAGSTVVAAAVFLTHRDVVTYKYGASDARFLGARPNNLLFMEAIAWGCANGMRALDLGRTDWGHESLRAFKLAWGAEERELRYQRLGSRDDGGDSPESGRGRAALSAVLRRSPAVVSRVAGEVLYRHAA